MQGLTHTERGNAAYGAAVGAIMQTFPEVAVDEAAAWMTAGFERASGELAAHVLALMQAVDNEPEISPQALFIFAAFCWGDRRQQTSETYNSLPEWRQMAFRAFRLVAAGMPRQTTAKSADLPGFMRGVRPRARSIFDINPAFLADAVPAIGTPAETNLRESRDIDLGESMSRKNPASPASLANRPAQ
jgi:hypothetical protein